MLGMGDRRARASSDQVEIEIVSSPPRSTRSRKN